MSNVQMMSGSFLPVSFSSLNGPSFSLSWKPWMSTAMHDGAVRHEIGDSPSITSGDDAMPWNGQSLARPDDELLERRLPHELAGRLRGTPSARRDRRGCFGSRIASLFVPTSTTPPATTGLP